MRLHQYFIDLSGSHSNDKKQWPTKLTYIMRYGVLLSLRIIAVNNGNFVVCMIDIDTSLPPCALLFRTQPANKNFLLTPTSNERTYTRIALNYARLIGTSHVPMRFEQRNSIIYIYVYYYF